MFTLASTAGVPAQSRSVFQAALAAGPDKATKEPVVNAHQSSIRVLNSAIETIEFSKSEQDRQRREATLDQERSDHEIADRAVDDRAAALEKDRVDHEFAEQKVDDQAIAAEAAKDDRLEKVDAEARAAHDEKSARDEHIDVFA